MKIDGYLFESVSNKCPARDKCEKCNLNECPFVFWLNEMEEYKKGIENVHNHRKIYECLCND